MKVSYRGFEISANRERALGGWDNLYFYIKREADGWFMADGFTEGDDKVEDFIGYLKERVDEYHADPTGECDEHAEGETFPACAPPAPPVEVAPFVLLGAGRRE